MAIEDRTIRVCNESRVLYGFINLVLIMAISE